MIANSRHSAAIFSPSNKRATNRTLSSITEHSFQGIASAPRAGTVTYVSGTNCHHLGVGPLTNDLRGGWKFDLADFRFGQTAVSHV